MAHSQVCTYEYDTTRHNCYTHMIQDFKGPLLFHVPVSHTFPLIFIMCIHFFFFLHIHLVMFPMQRWHRNWKKKSVLTDLMVMVVNIPARW